MILQCFVSFFGWKKDNISRNRKDTFKNVVALEKSVEVIGWPFTKALLKTDNRVISKTYKSTEEWIHSRQLTLLGRYINNNLH